MIIKSISSCNYHTTGGTSFLLSNREDYMKARQFRSLSLSLYELRTFNKERFSVIGGEE